MRTATAKKLLKEAGLTFSTQVERFWTSSSGNFWFDGESRLFPFRARFYLIQGEINDKKLKGLSDYLISQGYETKILNDCVEITNLN
jgi:hypothetical protein